MSPLSPFRSIASSSKVLATQIRSPSCCRHARRTPSGHADDALDEGFGLLCGWKGQSGGGSGPVVGRIATMSVHVPFLALRAPARPLGLGLLHGPLGQERADAPEVVPDDG